MLDVSSWTDNLVLANVQVYRLINYICCKINVGIKKYILVFDLKKQKVFLSHAWLPLISLTLVFSTHQICGTAFGKR